jgi:carbon starvation protein
VISELFGGLNLKALTNRYVATFVAVVSALILAFATGASGKGAMKLWPLFGATNQTLASLALIIITLYLKRRGGVKWVISGIPAVFMAVMTIWALILNQVKFGAADNMLLTVINICILLIALWIAIEGVIKFFATGEEPAAPAEPETA